MLVSVSQTITIKIKKIKKFSPFVAPIIVCLKNNNSFGSNLFVCNYLVSLFLLLLLLLLTEFVCLLIGGRYDRCCYYGTGISYFISHYFARHFCLPPTNRFTVINILHPTFFFQLLTTTGTGTCSPAK